VTGRINFIIENVKNFLNSRHKNSPENSLSLPRNHQKTESQNHATSYGFSQYRS